MNRIVVALKNMSPKEAVSRAKQYQGKVWGIKMNDMLRNDLSFIQDVRQYVNVMADPKLFDIPEDMENQFRQLVDAGCNIVTIHAASMWTPPGDLLDKVVGVTVLTSFDDDMCKSVYGCDVSWQIEHLLYLAGLKSYPMAVCSAADLRDEDVQYQIENHNIKPICPSIRLPEQIIINDDQNPKRKMAPGEAVEAGAHLIVVGRPILQANDPISVIDRMNEDIGDL